MIRSRHSNAPDSARFACRRNRAAAGFLSPQLFSAVIDVARADPLSPTSSVPHFWFVEERLRTVRPTPRSAALADKVADGKLFGNAFSGVLTLSAALVFNTRLLPDGSAKPPPSTAKFYSTGTLFSDYLTVTATTDHDSVATVVRCRRTEPGCAASSLDHWDGFGQRRTGTGTTTFAVSRSPPTKCSPTPPYDAREPEPTVQYASLQLFIHAVVAGIAGLPSWTTASRCCGHATAVSVHAPSERPPRIRCCSAS